MTQWLPCVNLSVRTYQICVVVAAAAGTMRIPIWQVVPKVIQDSKIPRFSITQTTSYVAQD